MSNFQQKPGTGVLFANNPPNGRHESAPSYKGFLMLPNGDVIGVALWKKEPKGGGKPFLSLAVDDKEGEFQAKKLKAPQMTMADTSPTQRGRGEKRAAASDDRPAQRGFNDDLDDEIPF